MANYVNLFNNTNKALSIEIVPKNQASVVTFKGEPPINYQRDADGVYRFTLATTMLDRMGLVIAFPLEYVFEKVDGVALDTPIKWTGKLSKGIIGNGAFVTDYDLAQLGIGVMRSRSNIFYQGELGERIDSVFLYNLNKNKNVVLEGYISGPDMSLPPSGGEVIDAPRLYMATVESDSAPPPMELPILRQRSTSLFDDPDLVGDSMIVDQDYNVGIALGGLHKPAGTGMKWQMGIYDQENLEGTIYIAMTVEHEDGVSVPLVYTSTVTRDSTEVYWSDSIDFDVLNENVITSFNEQYAEATGFELPLFADARIESSGALFLISFTYEVDDTINPFLPDVLTDTIDGSWGKVGPIIKEPVEAMAMAANGSSIQPMSVEDGSEEVIIDGDEEQVEYTNPLSGLDRISVRVQGTPLINVLAISKAMNNRPPDSEVSIPEDALEEATAQLYKLQNTRLVIHTANPEEGRPLIHFGHNTENSALRKWGEDANDFTILSAGVMLLPLRQLVENGPPNNEDHGAALEDM